MTVPILLEFWDALGHAAAEVTGRWHAALFPLFASEVATEGPITVPEIFRLD